MDILMEKRERRSAALSGWWARLRAARWLWLPLLVFAGTRLGILLVAYLAAGLMADSPFVPPYQTVIEAASNIAYDQDRYMSAWLFVTQWLDGTTVWRSSDGRETVHITPDGTIIKK